MSSLQERMSIVAKGRKLSVSALTTALALQKIKLTESEAALISEVGEKGPKSVWTKAGFTLSPAEDVDADTQLKAEQKKLLADNLPAMVKRIGALVIASRPKSNGKA